MPGTPECLIRGGRVMQHHERAFTLLPPRPTPTSPACHGPQPGKAELNRNIYIPTFRGVLSRLHVNEEQHRFAQYGFPVVFIITVVGQFHVSVKGAEIVAEVRSPPLSGRKGRTSGRAPPHIHSPRESSALNCVLAQAAISSPTEVSPCLPVG